MYVNNLMLEIFIQTFFLYFIVIDPLGTTPLFLIVTQHMKTKQKIKTALGATTIAGVILLFFALLGSFFVKLFKYIISCIYDCRWNYFIFNFYGNVV